jgi:predicted transcriptional regulator
MLSLVDPRELSEYIVDDMLSIFLLDDLRVALTVTENSFSLGLFSVDGTYDYGMDLISNTESAIKWGEQLFDELLSRSERLDLRQLSFEGT